MISQIVFNIRDSKSRRRYALRRGVILVASSIDEGALKRLLPQWSARNSAARLFLSVSKRNTSMRAQSSRNVAAQKMFNLNFILSNFKYLQVNQLFRFALRTCTVLFKPEKTSSNRLKPLGLREPVFGDCFQAPLWANYFNYQPADRLVNEKYQTITVATFFKHRKMQNVDVNSCSVEKDLRLEFVQEI